MFDRIRGGLMRRQHKVDDLLFRDPVQLSQPRGESSTKLSEERGIGWQPEQELIHLWSTCPQRVAANPHEVVHATWLGLSRVQAA